ncbi:MAG: hypothetical protein GF308_08930 [Candidatus Heimdallarchaeota archaeon]|nr:hypothetical protein [Candidatus Heimdallarchaeota archaeon]
MAISVATWFYLIIHGIIILVPAISIISFIQNFFRKKNISTALLAITHAFMALADILTSVGIYFQALSSRETLANAGIALAKFSFYMIPFVLINLYILLNTHLMRDNELVKITTILLVAFISFTALGAFLSDNPSSMDNWQYTNTIIFNGTNITFPFPKVHIFLLIVLPAILLIGTRSMYRLFILRREAKDELMQRGLFIIALSFPTIVLSTAIPYIAYFLLPNNHPAWMITVTFLRALLVILSGTAMSFGWIMPAWLRAKLRGKTWIEKYYKNTDKSIRKTYPSSTKENVSIAHSVEIKD